MTYMLRPYQEKLKLDASKAAAEHKHVIAQAPGGTGKCLGAGTKVLMSDMSFKNVEDIKVGDEIMGDDGTTRNVLSCANGIDKMYKITPVKGSPFICNQPHILSLISNCDIPQRGISKNNIIDISLSDYILLPKWIREDVLRLYRSYGFNYDNNKNLLLDPYFLGLWLGDGDSKELAFTSMDDSIIKYIFEYAELMGEKPRFGDSSNCGKAKRIFISNNYKRGGIRTKLRKYGVFGRGKKRIPKDYLLSSINDRMELLAGILDTDGHYSKGGYDLFINSPELSMDVKMLVQSLGLYCTRKKKKNVNGYRLYISGDIIDKIPCKIENKKASKRGQIKDALRTGFSVEYIGIGEYYGFEIDGNNRFVITEDFFVTHNTKTFLSIAKSGNEKGRAVLIISERTAVYQQIAEESNGIRIGDGIKYVDVYSGGLYVAMAQTLTRRPKIIAQFNDLPKEVIVIVDECHISTAKSVLDKLHNRITIGFTATPDYRIAKHLPKYFNELVTTDQVKWFIDKGYLCDYQHIVRKSGKATNALKKTGGDFNEVEQRKFFGTEDHYKELFKDLGSIPFKKCMLFTASIKHADEVYDRMKKEGYLCSIAHSKRHDYTFQLAKFRELNETNIIISVGSLTTGFDMPEVDCIVLYRATTSLALYLQMIFRADRPKDGMFFWVLDYGMNGERHGTYDQDRDWNKLWRKPEKRKRAGVAGVKICPECDSMIFVAATKCKFCTYEFPEIINKELGEADDITNKKAQLHGKLISQLTPKELALYANIYDKKSFAARVARSKHQSDGVFLIEYARFMGYKYGWIKFQSDQINVEKIGFKDYML